MISAEIFKDNSIVWVKAYNRMTGRRQLPVSYDIAERYLIEYGKVSRTDVTPEAWVELVEKTRRDLSVSKKVLPLPELDAIAGALAAIRSDALRSYCNRTNIGKGFYLIKTELIGGNDKIVGLAQFIASRMAAIQTGLIPALLAKYDDAVSKVRTVWGDKVADSLPDKADLPDLFGVEYTPLTFSVPEGLPPEIRAREETKLRETFEQARQTVIAALWEEMQALVDHLLERLTPSADGTAKTFQKGTVDNLKVFIEAFSNRDAFNDTRLAEVVTKASNILSSVGNNGDIPKRLREYSDVRETTREAFASLKAEVDKGLEDVASRVFNFEE